MATDTQNPFLNGFKSFKNFKFPGFNVEPLGTSFQKNIEWMTEIQKIATQGTQSLVELRIPLKVAADSAPKLPAITTKVAVLVGALAT